MAVKRGAEHYRGCDVERDKTTSDYDREKLQER